MFLSAFLCLPESTSFHLLKQLRGYDHHDNTYVIDHQIDPKA